MPHSKPKILYFVTEDWYFLSHRLPIARAAKKEGFEVIVVTNVNNMGAALRREGFKLILLSLNRSGKNPIRELLVLLELIRIYRAERPDIAHHVALKPVLYGSVAAMFAGTRSTINALAGLGHVFVAKGAVAAIIRFFARGAIRLALCRKGSKAIFQNPEDMDYFINNRLLEKRQAILIKGSGVDTSQYLPPSSEPAGIPVVILISRMLKTKGVEDFIKAAKILKQKNVKVRMALAGAPDRHNPASISIDILKAWNDEGDIEYWGEREDIPDVLKRVSIVALPSFYGEGVPKCLIEAASACRYIVAYDIAGCREIVADGVNGALVPPRDVSALALAIEKALADKEGTVKMGRSGRAIVEKEFSEKYIVAKTMAFYKANLNPAQSANL